MHQSRVGKRVHVLGIEVDKVGLQDIHEMVDTACERGGATRVMVAMNPEKVMLLEKDAALRSLYSEADVILPDGVGVRLAARLLAGEGIARLTGVDVMLELARYAAERRYSVALIGASETTNREACRVLCHRFPGLRIAFRHDGYFRREEIPELLNALAAAGPNITFVGLGSPAQELFVARYRNELGTNVTQCVGGTFDTLTGRVKRAPGWVQSIGCEWLYRLLKQPSRAGRQLRLLVFSARVLREFCTVRIARRVL